VGSHQRPVSQGAGGWGGTVGAGASHQMPCKFNGKRAGVYGIAGPKGAEALFAPPGPLELAALAAAVFLCLRAIFSSDMEVHMRVCMGE
jgi:hypothetical protein